MIDHQQRAAGERPNDYATETELKQYYIARCYEAVNRARAAHGLPPYVSSREKSARLTSVNYNASQRAAARFQGRKK